MSLFNKRQNRELTDDTEQDEFEEGRFLLPGADLSQAAPLSQVNVPGEIAVLLHAARSLVNTVMAPGSGFTPTEISKALTTYQATLREVAKIRTDVYNSERLRRVEAVVVDLLQDESEDLRRRFVEELERRLALVNVQVTAQEMAEVETPAGNE